MSSLRRKYIGFYIGGEKKAFVVLSIEDKKELMFGMCLADPFKILLGEPPDSF